MFKSVFGRSLILALPALALGACSAFEQPYLPSGAQASYGQYDQGCQPSACAPGQSYSVAAPIGGNAGPDHWPDKQLIPNYEHGGPVHVNPTRHGYSGHGQQYGAQHAQGYGAGQPPHLRGLRGQKQGHFYGTVGGVMYDTDVDSFGLEGRLGYDSGRIFGAEVEGSVGVIDEKDTATSAIGPINTKAGFDYNLAAFALARLPLSERFSLHARGGYDVRELSVKATAADGTSATVSEKLDGFAYGVGAEYALSPRDGLRLDLTRYDNEFGASDSVSASYTRKF